MGMAYGTRGGEEKWVQGFGGEPGGKRPLGRPIHRRVILFK